MSPEVAENLRTLREQAGMSVSELAGRLGISDLALELAEQGRRALPNAVLKRAAAELSVSPGKLLGVPLSVVPTPTAGDYPDGAVIIKSFAGRRLIFVCGAPPKQGAVALFRRDGGLCARVLGGGERGIVAVATKELVTL